MPLEFTLGKCACNIPNGCFDSIGFFLSFLDNILLNDVVHFILQGFVAVERGSLGGDRDAIHLRPAGRDAGHEASAVLQEAPGFHDERPDGRQPGHRRMQVPVSHQTLELLHLGRDGRSGDQRPTAAHHRPSGRHAAAASGLSFHQQ